MTASLCDGPSLPPPNIIRSEDEPDANKCARANGKTTDTLTMTSDVYMYMPCDVSVVMCARYFRSTFRERKRTNLERTKKTRKTAKKLKWIMHIAPFTCEQLNCHEKNIHRIGVRGSCSMSYLLSKYRTIRAATFNENERALWIYCILIAQHSH